MLNNILNHEEIIEGSSLTQSYENSDQGVKRVMVSDSGMKFDFLIKLVQEDNLIKKVDQLKYKIQLYTEQQRIRNKSFNQAINNLENILKLRGYALLKNWGIFEHSIKDRELDKVLEKKIDNNIRQVAKKDHKMKTMRNIRERAMKANGCF